MPDRLSVSLWIRGFDDQTMLGHFEQLLATFPFSNLRPGISALRIYAVEDAEPPLIEEQIAGQVDLQELVAAAGEFQNPDCAYIVEGWWELWQPRDPDWKLAPSPVSLICFGPQFQNDLGDHLRIEFPSDRPFLPEPDLGAANRKIQSNIKGLLRLVNELQGALPVEKTHLWSESEEDFGIRLEAALEEMEEMEE